MLTEINYDFILAGKKAIFDYVLKDEGERLRIGVMQSFSPAEDYGCSRYKGIIATPEWIAHVAEARRDIEDKLMINDEGTLNIMKEWRTYENSRFSVLNKKKTLILQPRDFSKKLDEMIAEIRSDLRTEWVKEVSIIFNK
jgi:dynein heavy chain